MKLIDNTPTGWEKHLTHINRGDLPHEWRELDSPVYSAADTARGRKLRDERVKARLSLREAAKLLDLSVVDLSSLERCRKRFEDEADFEKALRLFGDSA